MNEKLGFLKKVGKNLCAFVLAFGVVAGTLIEYSVPVLADNGLLIEEKVGSGPNDYEMVNMAQVAVGHVVRVRTDNTLGEFGFDPSGFSFTAEGIDEQQAKDYLMVSPSGKEAPITVKKMPRDSGSGYLDEVPYTAVPIVMKQIVNGSGTLNYTTTEGGSKGISAVVTSKADPTSNADKSISITSRENSFTIHYDVENPGAARYVGSGNPFKGTWAESYSASSELNASLPPDGDRSKFRVQVKGATNPSLQMTFQLTLPEDFKEGTIKIVYSFQGPTDMTITTYSERRTLSDVVQNFDQHWNNEPSNTGKKIPYVQFAANEDWENVGKNFTLLTNFYKYNAPLQIKWTARNATVDDDMNYTVEDAPCPYLEIERTASAETVKAKIIDLPDDDQWIELEGEISFKESKAPADQKAAPQKVKKLIKLLGTGKMPAFKLTGWKKWINYNGTQTPDTTKTFPADGNAPIGGWTMEVYDGNVKHVAPQNTQEEWGVNRLEGTIAFGTGRKEARTVKITATGSGQIELLQNGAPTGDILTSQGVTLTNEKGSGSENYQNVEFVARKKGIVNITLTFSDTVDYTPPVRLATISIEDHSPNDDAHLRSLGLTAVPVTGMTPEQQEAYNAVYPNGKIDYTFDPETAEYDISVGNVVESVKITPNYRYISPYLDNRPVSISINNGPMVNFPDGGIYGEDTDSNGNPTVPVPLREGVPVQVTIRSYAEDNSIFTYTLNIWRAGKSEDSSLEEITVKDLKTQNAYPLDPEFPSDVTNEYRVSVPFSVEKVRVTAVAHDTWAQKPQFEVSGDGAENVTRSLLGIFKPSGYVDVKVPFIRDPNDPDIVTNTATVTITVKSEAATNDDDAVIPQTQYKVIIVRQPPSENDNLQEPKVFNKLKGGRQEMEVGLDNYAAGQAEIYSNFVKYSTNRVRLVLTPEDYRATKITVKLKDELKPKEHVASGQEPSALEFIFDDINGSFDENELLKFDVTVYPESSLLNPDKVLEPQYTIYVQREQPNRDTTANITLTNMLTNENIEFGYSNVIDDYPVKEIEYTPGDMKVLVQVEPTAASTEVLVNNAAPRPGGVPVQLTEGSTTTIKITLTAEDGSQRNITIPLKYNGPSKNCYLFDLTAGGFKFLPAPTMFDKDKTSYKIEIPKGTASFPVTATLLKDGSKKDSSKATITINDAPVADGEAYTFTPSDKTGKISVVVTAQDGKSKRTYTINYKNWNLLVPSDENTLKDLKVDYGDMQPTFEPGTQEYEVYVKPDAMNLKLFPKLKDPDGQIRVVAGKVLTEFDDAYSVSLMDDEMDIQIYVWSEKDIVDAGINSNTTTATTAPSGEAAGTGTNTDMSLNKANAREYVLHVYRNDEEKIGNLKPITAEMVDFVTADPIVIDITKYPIISADVFNTLKTDYVDKSILFKGNDYTLQIFGEDIDGLVPHTETFDLRFSFFTPDQNKIEDLLDDIGNNDRIDPVYYYFNQHGALPAEMLLTVNLGRHYRNEYLYWNYYNPERERIDYYGYVRTNATGTFSVPISHFSTYLSTEDKIRGAENKSEEYGNPELSPQQENLNAPSSANKSIPNTGVGVNR